MKLILPITLMGMILCVFQMSEAQNIKNERMQVKFLQPPTNPLDSSIQTYRHEIEATSLSLSDSRKQLTERIASAYKLIGKQYKIVTSNPDLLLYARLEGFRSEGTNVASEEREETKSDKTKVKYRVYYGTSNVNYPLFIRIKNTKEDKIIFEGYIDGSDRYEQLRTSQYRDYETARNEINRLVGDSKGKLFDRHLDDLRSMMIGNYSFFPTEEYWSINYVETSKKENYDDVVAAKDATMKALQTLNDSTNVISTTTMSAMENAISLWQKILQESDVENKKARVDRKVTSAILENLAFCNYFINNFEEAEKYKMQGEALKKQQWQYDLGQGIENRKKRFQANGIVYH